MPGSGFAPPAALCHTAAFKPEALGVEQSNSSIRFGQQLILKCYRRLERGLHPELELGRFLTERARFSHVPALAGWIDYADGSSANRAIAVLHRYVHPQANAWNVALESLKQYVSASCLAGKSLPFRQVRQRPKVLLARSVRQARLLGARVGQLHAALASDGQDEAFRPERFEHTELRIWSGKLIASVQQAAETLARQTDLFAGAKSAAGQLLGSARAAVERRYERLAASPLGCKIRCHGDLHLGQLPCSGDDLLIIAIDGEPARPLAERRAKSSPLKDVAGMIRSFDYAAATLPRNWPIGADGERVVRVWQQETTRAFYSGYLAVIGRGHLLPEKDETRACLLELFLLEKAAYELLYELNNRPDWVTIPLEGLTKLLKGEQELADNTQATCSHE